jgi:hypothetical protein
MPQVGFHHLGQGKISAGDTLHFWWNNAGRQKVWAFSVDAEVQLIFAFSGAVAKLEITKVEYRQNFNGPSASDTEQEIHFWLKNTGTVHANYYLHMSTVQE